MYGSETPFDQVVFATVELADKKLAEQGPRRKNTSRRAQNRRKTRLRQRADMVRASGSPARGARQGHTTSHAARGVFTLQMAKLRAVEHQQLRQRAARMRVAVRVLCGRVAVSAAQVSSDVEPPGLHPAHKWLLSARVPSFPATLQDSVCTRGAVPALVPTLVSTWCTAAAGGPESRVVSADSHGCLHVLPVRRPRAAVPGHCRASVRGRCSARPS